MFSRHSRSSSWQSILYQSTPKTPRSRSGFLIPFWVVLCLLLSVLCLPDTVERLHCMLGLRQHCDTTVPIAQAVMYNRYAIQRSCTPSREGGKVVVVTGSAGFIGFTASLALKARGDGVVGIDNFNDYYPVSLKHARASELASTGIHTVHGDINNLQLLQQVFEICRPTHVIHLAAQAGVRYAASRPLVYIDSNVRGTSVLLEAVRMQRPMPHLIYASSSSVYGRNDKVPFTETDRVDTPASLYAATKRSCELLASVYHNIYNVSTTGLRFFTVYGPWGRPDMAALAFAHKIVEGHPVKIFQGPDGSELARDFTYIDDIVDGILGALDTAAPGQERLFNLGNTHPHTVSEFVDLLEGALGKAAVRHLVSMPRLGDVMQTHSNITAAREEFGYEPSMSLSDGLRHFASWFYAYYGTNGSNLQPDEVTYQPNR